jgi:16S rRNA processing protein RimM
VVASSADQIAAAEGHAARTWVELGSVLRPHGLDGALLVALHSDDPTNLLAVSELRLRGQGGTIPFRVLRAEAAGVGKGGRARVRLWLAGLTRDRAELFAGAELLIRESELAALPEGEFYWRELIGLRALAADGTELGRVRELVATGGQDVLVIEREGKDLLLPAGVIQRLDRERGELWLDPSPELLEASR